MKRKPLAKARSRRRQPPSTARSAAFYAASTAAVGSSDLVADADAVELCQRVVHPIAGLRCLGVVYRGQPDVPYCIKCGSHDPGAFYARTGFAATPVGKEEE